MAKISLNYGTKDAIEKETITDGAVYLSTDTDELFVDLSGLRHIIGGGPLWTEMEQPPSYTVPTINTTDSSVDFDQATGTYTVKLNFSNVAGEPYSVSQMNTVNAGKVTVNDQAVNAVQSVTKTDNAVNVVFNAGEVRPTESGTATLAVASGFKVNDDTMTDQAISFEVPCPIKPVLFECDNLTNGVYMRNINNDFDTTSYFYTTNTSQPANILNDLMDSLTTGKWLTIDNITSGTYSITGVQDLVAIGKIGILKENDKTLSMWIYREDKTSTNKLNLSFTRTSTSQCFNKVSITYGTGTSITPSKIWLCFVFDHKFPYTYPY